MKFPFYKQFDSMDCGPSCLRMISKFYGRHYSLQTLRDSSNLSRNGVSFQGIKQAAKSIGFRTKSVQINWKQLSVLNTSLPCIVHWNKNHFVVVYKIREKDGKVFVADPAHGYIKYTKEEFIGYWIADENYQKGRVLLLSPTEDFFNRQEEPKSFFRVGRLLEYLKPYYQYLILLLAIMLLGSLISLIFPFLTQEMVDLGIKNKNSTILFTILIAQIILLLGQLINELLRSWLMLHITARVGISFISDYLSKLMRLPIAFFDKKKMGDIMQRIEDNSKINTFLTGTLISIIVSFVSFIIYTIVIAKYNFTILYCFLLGSFFYVIWVIGFLRKRRELNFKEFQESSASKNNIMQLISGMQEIKLNSCEKQKRWEWERIQVKLFQINIKSLVLNQAQQAGGGFINQLKNILISYLAALAVINGEMTLGMMLAMQFILGQLNAPLNMFVNFIQEAQDAKISFERITEVYEKQDEEPFEVKKNKNIPKSAHIQLNDVSFGYNDETNYALKNINITIKQGNVTAIVGTSGSGKTTLLKLLLGFYKPLSGTIYLGDKLLCEYSESAWRLSCGVVMQENFIFSDTIANNIGIIDKCANREKLEYAANIANISSFINSLPLGYDTLIGNDGIGLSMGQKQRILIARAVYKNPDYIFLDEATNALDVTNEKIIMENLQKFYDGKTVIIIAHRLSTVKGADNIVVLDRGCIIETGTHEELINQRGNYFTLVKNQIELNN